MSRFSGCHPGRAAQTPRNGDTCGAGPRLASRLRVKTNPLSLATLSLPLALAIAATACDSEPSTPPPECASGTICTWAGNGEPAFYGDGLDRREAMLYWPIDLAFAPDGRAYILDWQNHRVRRVNQDGVFETVIGTGDVGDGPESGRRTHARRASPAPTATSTTRPTSTFDPDGTSSLAAWHNHKVRRLDPGHRAGRGGRQRQRPGIHGRRHARARRADEPAQGRRRSARRPARCTSPTRKNFRIRRIDTHRRDHDRRRRRDGRASRATAGRPRRRSSSSRSRTTTPSRAAAWRWTAQDRLYIVDTENQRIRRIDFAADVDRDRRGERQRPGSRATAAPRPRRRSNYPRDVAIGPDGRLYIADTDNHRVRAVDLATGVITTVVGNGDARFGGDGGAPAAASLQRPWGIAFDRAGNLYIADTFNNRIRMVMP